jgi:hypothetical protein
MLFRKDAETRVAISSEDSAVLQGAFQIVRPRGGLEFPRQSFPAVRDSQIDGPSFFGCAFCVFARVVRKFPKAQQPFVGRQSEQALGQEANLMVSSCWGIDSTPAEFADFRVRNLARM